MFCNVFGAVALYASFIVYFKNEFFQLRYFIKHGFIENMDFAG
jgi:hypothetical protein